MKQIRKLWPRLVRGLLSLSVLLGVCAMLLPLPIAPLPQNSPEKDSSEPFPCQNRPCGCRSADQCWKKCCCFNNAQKVAWAKANNVKVPEFVLVAAKKEGVPREHAFVSPKSRLMAVSATKNGRCCESKSVVAVKTSCCDKSPTQGSPKSLSCGTNSGPAARTTGGHRTPASSKWVMAVHAAECQGQGPPAFCFPISIIPDRLLLVTPSVEVIESCILESERLLEVSLQPPLPPPKIV